jgi:hypothetical protein
MQTIEKQTMNPFQNHTWVRNCIATGAITPPRGSEIERADRITIYVVISMVTVGALISWGVFLWR